MTMNVSEINNLDNTFNNNSTKEKSNKEFSLKCDLVEEGIRRNVKDPIDREEDLMLWKNLSKSFKLNNSTYEEFKKFKNDLVSFPPLSAPGRVRRAYREYMQKLPKDVRDKMQGILTFTYADLMHNKSIDSSNWQQVIRGMMSNIGKIGDLDTDFDFIRRCVGDFAQFDIEQKEDESVKQILI